MKKTQIIELFAKIKKTFVSFLSITMFVFLGIAVFQGLGWAGYSQKKTIDDNFINYHGYDFKAYLPFGISRDDIDELKENENIDEVEGSFVCYEYFTHDDYKYLASVQSLTETINQPCIIEGRLPESANELVIVGGAKNNSPIKIGDTINFTKGNSEENFSIRIMRDYGNITFSDDDENITLDNFKETQFTVTGIICTPQYLSNSRLSYGVSPFDSTQIDFAFFTKYEFFNELITGGFYNNIFIRSNSLRGLDSFSGEYKQQVKEIADLVTPDVEEYANKYANKIKGNIVNIPSIVQELQLYAMQGLLQGIIDQNTFDKMSLLFNDIDDKASVLIESPSYILLKRSDNAIFVFGEMLSDCIVNVRYSLGGLFIVISIIICYSTITRLVNDDKKFIGTKKALGLYQKEILLSYLLYSLICVFVGGIFGNVLAFFISPLVANSTSGAFNFVGFSPYYNLVEAGILFGGLLVVIVLISLVACQKILKENPIKLLQGGVERRNKIRFYEKTKLWKNSSLLNKTIVNNTINDKRRVFATIFGVLGCSCMLVAALMMKNNITYGFEKQYSEYFDFDTFINFDSNDADSIQQIESYLQDNQITYIPMLRETAAYAFDNKEPQGGFIMVYFDNGAFNEMVHFESASDKEFNNKGIWVQESYLRHFKNTSDSIIEITNGSTGEIAISKIEGYYKYYSYMGMVFMNDECYEEIFGKTAVPNIFLTDLDGRSVDSVNGALKDIEGYQSIFDYVSYSKLDLDVFNIVSTAIVGIYLIVSTLLSVFVILNLLKTFVNEKKRDLITMMINGYSLGDTYKYIYIDTIVLTIIGLILGVGLGILVGSFVIKAFEGASMYLLHTPSLQACLIGAGVTIVLVVIMSFIAISKIRKFKLTEINSNV